ncbi:MAG: outer membrane beta-barrel protein [Gammaproteobacteria bacterium]
MKHFSRGCMVFSLLIGSSACFAVGPYAGVSLGFMDEDGADSNPLNGGFTLGYDFSADAATFGAEAEFTTSLSDGDVNDNDFSIDTQALYLTGKLDFTPQVYGKARIGLLRVERDRDSHGSESDNGVSAGVGIGYKVAPQINLEAEITNVEEDINFFSVGIRYNFY